MVCLNPRSLDSDFWIWIRPNCELACDPRFREKFRPLRSRLFFSTIFYMGFLGVGNAGGVKSAHPYQNVSKLYIYHKINVEQLVGVWLLATKILVVRIIILGQKLDIKKWADSAPPMHISKILKYEKCFRFEDYYQKCQTLTFYLYSSIVITII